MVEPDDSEIEATLNLLSNYTTVSVPSRLVFVVGVTGTGKSTLTQFIVRNKRLYAESVNGGQVIKGDPSIGETVSLSFTTRPNLVRDTDTNVDFVDCPGFGDTRNFSYDIASTFYTKMLLNGTRDLKILAVIDYHSLRSHRKGFTELLKHMTAFVNNFDAYQPSIGLVVTKRAIPADSDMGQERKYILNHLAVIRQEQARNLDYVRLIDAFTRSSGDAIEIFREPPTSGPLFQNTAMQQNLRDLRHLVFDKLYYSKVNPQDFRMTISDTTELVVQLMIRKLEKQINQLISRIWDTALLMAVLPDYFELPVASGIFDQFWKISDTLHGDHTRDVLVDTEFTTLLVLNNFTINQAAYDDLERKKRSQRLLFDLLRKPAESHYIDKAQVRESFQNRVNELADTILDRCNRTMDASVKVVMRDFTNAYAATVAANRDLAAGKRLLQSLLSLKQKIATYNHVNFTVPGFEREMKKCVDFSSNELAPLIEAERVLQNVQKVRHHAAAWSMVSSAIKGYTLSANASAWQLVLLLNERVDHHVDVLSGAVVKHFLAKYRHNDRWFQKRNMKLPLLMLEPIIVSEFVSYNQFLTNVTGWTALYNSSGYTEPLARLDELRPDWENVLSLKDETVALPKKYRWARKLDGATGYLRNSASRPGSPITSLYRWVRGMTQTVVRMLETTWTASQSSTLPPLLAKSAGGKMTALPLSGYSINTSLLLLDLLVRKVFKTRGLDRNTADEDDRWRAQAAALNIVAECEAKGGDFDYVHLQQQVMRRLVTCAPDQVAIVREQTLARARFDQGLCY